MEITTFGKGKGSFVPDEVYINLLFRLRSNNYETVLNEGNKSIDDFVNQVLIGLGFTKNDLKIRNINVKEEKEYNNITKSYDLVGYLFEGDALLKFPYDKDLIALFLILMAKLENPPQFNLEFGLINEEKYKKELIEEAYQDALTQASIIANSANKKITDTLKVSFQPLDEPFVSSTDFTSKNILYANENNVNDFVNYLNPINIEVEEVLYGLFLAE